MRSVAERISTHVIRIWESAAIGIAIASATVIENEGGATMSSARIFVPSETGWRLARLGLAILRFVGAAVCLSLSALLGLLEPLARLVLGSLAVLALLLSGFYAFAVPFKAFPVFGLLGAALALTLLIGLLRALRNALTLRL